MQPCAQRARMLEGLFRLGSRNDLNPNLCWAYGGARVILERRERFRVFDALLALAVTERWLDESWEWLREDYEPYPDRVPNSGTAERARALRASLRMELEDAWSLTKASYRELAEDMGYAPARSFAAGALESLDRLSSARLKVFFPDEDLPPREYDLPLAEYRPKENRRIEIKLNPWLIHTLVDQAPYVARVRETLKAGDSEGSKLLMLLATRRPEKIWPASAEELRELLYGPAPEDKNTLYVQRKRAKEAALRLDDAPGWKAEAKRGHVCIAKPPGRTRHAERARDANGESL